MIISWILLKVKHNGKSLLTSRKGQAVFWIVLTIEGGFYLCLLVCAFRRMINNT